MGVVLRRNDQRVDLGVIEYRVKVSRRVLEPELLAEMRSGDAALRDDRLQARARTRHCRQQRGSREVSSSDHSHHRLRH